MKTKRNLTSDPLKPFPSPNFKSRPNHKAEFLALKVQIEFDKKHPEPMSLMHKRVKNKEVPSEADAEISLTRCGRVYCPPEVTRGKVEAAARAMADWDSSDPFAYGRTALHVAQGFVDPREIVAEMSKRTLARRAARRAEVDHAKLDA